MLWSRSCIVLSDTVVTNTISCTSFYAALNSSDKAIQLQFLSVQEKVILGRTGS